MFELSAYNKTINKKNHKILFEKVWFNKDLQRKIIDG